MTVAAVLALLAPGGLRGQSDAPAVSEGAKALKVLAASFQSMASYQAEFTQTQEWVGMESGTSWRGTLYLKRPNLFRLEYREPPGHLQVCDGRVVWTYVPENGEVLKTRLSGQTEQGGDLLRWVLNSGTAEPKLGSDEIGGKPAQVISVAPPEGLGLILVRFWIRPNSSEILQYEVTDSSENRTIYRLLKFKRNPKLKDALFQFSPPAGVPVVEMGGP